MLKSSSPKRILRKRPYSATPLPLHPQVLPPFCPPARHFVKAHLSEGSRRPLAHSSRVPRVTFTLKPPTPSPPSSRTISQSHPHWTWIRLAFIQTMVHCQNKNGPLLKQEWSIVKTKRVHCWIGNGPLLNWKWTIVSVNRACFEMRFKRDAWPVWLKIISSLTES